MCNFKFVIRYILFISSCDNGRESGDRYAYIESDLQTRGER